MSQIRCPKCGKNATCHYEGFTGFGELDQEDCLTCAHCGYHEETALEDAGVWGSVDSSICPYCHKRFCDRDDKKLLATLFNLALTMVGSRMI